MVFVNINEQLSEAYEKPANGSMRKAANGSKELEQYESIICILSRDVSFTEKKCCSSSTCRFAGNMSVTYILANYYFD